MPLDSARERMAYQRVERSQVSRLASATAHNMNVVWRRRFSHLSLAAALVATFGCAASPKHTTFLSSYASMDSGRFIDGSWADASAIKASNPSAIVLGEIDTSAIRDRKGVTTEDATSALRDALVGRGTGREKVLSLHGDGPVARLEVAITEMTPGDAVARVIAAELGAGHAMIQVDGRVLDSETGKPLAALVDRRRGTGALGLRDTFGSSGPTMVREMLQGVGEDFRRELGFLFE